MSQRNRPDAARRPQLGKQDFFRPNDAIWLTDVVARELKEKQAAAAAPRIRDRPGTTSDTTSPSTPPPHRAAADYGPTRIVPATTDDDEVPASAERSRRGGLKSLLRRGPRRARPPAARAVVRAKPKQDRSDFIVGAMGVALGLTCALFPWYIFFNQEKFGVREFVFSGEGGTGVPTEIAYQPTRIGQPFSQGEVPKMALDFFPTATTAPPEGGSPQAVSVADQPFPADLVSYQLVHVANGRAMIMDEAGLWVVQPGSQLPDASRVASIEKRDGRWVIVTTLDRVVALEP